MKLYVFLIAMLAFFASSCTKQPDTTLTVTLGGEPAELDFWEQLIHNFETEKNVKVNFIRQPADTDQRRQQLVIALKSKQSDPDVFLMDVAWSIQFAASGWLEPLDGYIAQHDIDTASFFPKIINLADTYKGNLIALPVYIDGGLLYYRKDLLEQYGYTAPPQTWDQLVEYSLKIQSEQRKTNNDFYGFVWQGLQYEGLVCNFLEVAASNNGGVIFQDDTIFFDTPENLKAVSLMRDFIHTHKISPQNVYTEMKEDDARMYFQAGNALFERNWPYAWPLHQSAGSAVKDRVGIAPLPHFSGGKSAATLGGWHIGISKFSNVKPLAWEFIEYVTSYKTQKQFALKLGWNPSRQDVYADPDVLAQLPHFAQLRAVFENAVPRPAVPYYMHLSEVIQKYVNAIIAGRIEPKAGLQSAEKEMRQIFIRYEK